ncbi:MAG: hypothetical protein ABIQ57_16200 [Candidatus Kapaibacterium sp.]
MDPLAPINGISLERYAELAAKMKDCGGDLEVCARIAGENGVDRPTWEAAMNGWNARMYDAATAGTVALAYMPLYQDALLKYGGPPAEASLEDYVGMTAMINCGDKSLDKMYAKYGIDAVKWSQISTHWVDKIIKDPAFGVQFKTMCDEEMARLEAANA